jgi:hypothetical protein
MMPDIERLLALLDKIVNATDKPWLHKKSEILQAASETDKSNIAEFCAWFEND